LLKSGLFAHFKSKEQVQLRLLDETARIAQATGIEPALKAPAGLKRLRVLPATSSPSTAGCPIRTARCPPNVAAVRMTASAKTTGVTGSA
jgi:hypothetical protein